MHTIFPSSTGTCHSYESDQALTIGHAHSKTYKQKFKDFIKVCNPVSSAIYLNPDYLWRRNPRWVSCYAFFQWWLLLSQHPHCLWIPTSSLVLSIYFGALNYDLGCFPFDLWNFAPTVLLPRLTKSIQSLIGFSVLRQVKTFQCFTPFGNTRR